MKKIICFLSIMLFALFSCTNEIVDSNRGNVTISNKVSVKFTLDDLPDFEIVTRAAGETEIASISLMTFDEGSNFLGRVEARMGDQIVGENGAISGSGSALVPLETSTIHFVVNYKWQGDQYVEPNGEKESTLMSSLTSGVDNFFVAWGVARDIDLRQNISVTMKRNYAKVTVESQTSEFVVAGFKLANYADKGTVTQKDDKLNVAPGYKLIRLSSDEATATDALYMYEYENPYGNQMNVIVKNKNNQYFKILLTENETGRPFKIQRNNQYHVIIEKIEAGVTGSPTYEAAVEAEPTNDIFAEVIKKAPTVSDKEKNRLTVSPVYCLFTDDGELIFTANYFKKGSTTTSNNEVSVTLIHNGHQKYPILSDFEEETVVRPAADGAIRTSVTLPVNRDNLKLDSATLKVKAGMLSRIVTVMISKMYNFNTQGFSYNGFLGQVLDLKFTMPDFPKELFPLKCYIKADGLNPVNDANQQPLLVEQKDGNVYYIYEINDKNYMSGKEVSLKFKTIVTGELPDDPTIENEYFHKGIFNAQYTNNKGFTVNSAGPAYYEKGSTFEYTFTVSGSGKIANVEISGDNINTLTLKDVVPGVYTVDLKTTKADAVGNITIKANGYSSKTVEYTNNHQLKNDYTTREADLKYWKKDKAENVTKNTVIYVYPFEDKRFSVLRDGKYTYTIPAGTSVNEEWRFACTINRVKYYASFNVSDLLIDKGYGIIMYQDY